MEMEKSKVSIQFLLTFRQSGDVVFFPYARRLRGYTATTAFLLFQALCGCILDEDSDLTEHDTNLNLGNGDVDTLEISRFNGRIISDCTVDVKTKIKTENNAA